LLRVSFRDKRRPPSDDQLVGQLAHILFQMADLLRGEEPSEKEVLFIFLFFLNNKLINFFLLIYYSSNI
jgi:hypothetical protein